MKFLKKNGGFTLVEVSAGMAAGVILLLAFSSLMVFSRQQTSAVTERISALRDGLMLDRYLRNSLAKTLGDSVRIYADASAEQSDSRSNTGTILKTEDRNGNTYRISVSNQDLVWQVNGLTHHPVDAEVIDLAFQQTSSNYGEKLSVDITLLSDKDTLTYDWVISFRN
ncbi:MAG: hypothetical protein V3T99_03805 [Nitrososphaerales archaeon]